MARLPELAVFGSDYPTRDRTGVRDYIHVMDLAEGHLQALRALQRLTGALVWNLGKGQGYSALEMVRAFEAASGRGVRIFVCEVLRDLSTAAGVACDERPTRWTSRFDIVTQPAW